MRSYGLYFSLVLIMIVLFLLEPLSSRYLRYDRELIITGEFWRLFSAHFVHLSLPHLLGNTLGVLLLGYIADSALNNRLGLILLLWCCAVVGVGLFAYADYLQRYVGFSGVLHGLLLVAPFISSFYSRPIAISILMVIVCKVIWEQTPFYDGAELAGLIGGRVEVNAHALGAIAGLIFLAGYQLFNLLKAEKPVEVSR
mgnify:CR=1 FL=1